MKQNTSQESHQNLIQILEGNQAKKNDLLNKYPCIQLKTQFRGFENRLVEVVLNESFLKVTGYTIDSFISIILKEGFPRYFYLLIKG